MKVYAIFILNKAGGLIYQNNISPSLNRLSANDYLVLAGTLHGVHAISSKLTPTIVGNNVHASDEQHSGSNEVLIATGKSQNTNTNKTGLQSIETDLFNLYVFQSLTGIKFIIITSPNSSVRNDHTASESRNAATDALNPSKGELQKQYDQASDIFRSLYVSYSDYVMKDPFYSLDMPIKSHLFDIKVRELVST